MRWTPTEPTQQLYPFDEVRRIATEALTAAQHNGAAPTDDTIPVYEFLEPIMQAVVAYGEQLAADATPPATPEPIGTETAAAALLTAATVMGGEADTQSVTDWAEQHALPWLLATAQQPRP